MPFLTKASQITRKEVRGLFAKSFITQHRDVLWPSIAEVIDTFTEREYFAALGTVPQVSLVDADHEVTASEINEYTYDMTNQLYKSLIRLRRSLLDFDQTGQSRTILNSMAARVVNFPDKLAMQRLRDGTSNTCISGSAFFANNHVMGSSGTMSNLLTGNTATSTFSSSPAARPDLAEKLVYDLDRALVALLGWKDDQGEPIHQKINPKDLLVVCSPLTFASMKMAVGAKFIKQTDNTFEGFVGGILQSNYLPVTGAEAADWYLIYNGYVQKPLVYSRFRLRTDAELQDKLSGMEKTGAPFNVTMEDLKALSSIELLTNLGSRGAMDADSHVILNEEFLLAARWRGEVAYGVPWTAIKMDNSA